MNNRLDPDQQKPAACLMVVYSLLPLSERWLRRIWLIGRMKFASFEADLGGGRGPFSLIRSNMVL